MNVSDGMNYAPVGKPSPVVKPGEFIFSAAHLDHGHIYGMTNALLEAGGTLKYVYDPDPDKVARFIKTYPQAVPARSEEEVLADRDTHMVAGAHITSERGPFGVRVMDAGKDYFTDKAPFTAMAQLDAAKAAVERTGRKYMVYYSERIHCEGAILAGYLIDQGLIGRVIHVEGFGPHRLGAAGRPAWFFEKEKYGGILCDIGSHQIEQYLYFAGEEEAQVTYSRIGEVVYATSDNRQRPFSPSLVWNEETDEVLLRVRTEAELNKDGGYVTDADGYPLWTGRYMRLSWLGFRLLNNIGVDAVSFSCNGAAINLRLEDLLGEDMQAFIKENRGDLKNARFRLSVEPMEEAEESHVAAADALRPVSRLWRVGVTLILDKKEIDVTDRLPSLTVSVAMLETQQLLEMMDRYDAAKFPSQFQLYSLPEGDSAFSGMDSAFIQPWMPEEMSLVSFPAAMYTYDYLHAPLRACGLVAVATAGK